MKKQELIAYVLYSKEKNGYLTGGAYIDKELCYAGYHADKNDALKLCSILDNPSEFEIRKMNIVYEIID